MPAPPSNRAPQSQAAPGKIGRCTDPARRGDQSLQTDPTGYDDGLNWYAYVGNDPMNATDPNGAEAYRRSWHDPDVLRRRGARDGAAVARRVQGVKGTAGAANDFRKTILTCAKPTRSVQTSISIVVQIAMLRLVVRKGRTSRKKLLISESGISRSFLEKPPKTLRVIRSLIRRGAKVPLRTARRHVQLLGPTGCPTDMDHPVPPARRRRHHQVPAACVHRNRAAARRRNRRTEGGKCV